jgi:hypothetical protein
MKTPDRCRSGTPPSAESGLRGLYFGVSCYRKPTIGASPTTVHTVSEGEFREVRLLGFLESMFTCAALRIDLTVTIYYVFGLYCSGIEIYKVRLCIRGSAIVPTILSFLSRAPRGA